MNVWETLGKMSHVKITYFYQLLYIPCVYTDLLVYNDDLQIL